MIPLRLFFVFFFSFSFFEVVTTLIQGIRHSNLAYFKVSVLRVAAYEGRKGRKGRKEGSKGR